MELAGMPRICTWHEKCVFFVYSDRIDNCIVGTGFLVSRLGHLYGITNHHVAQLGCGRVLSFNKINSGTRRIVTDEEDWIDLREEDLSAVDLTDKIESDDDLSAISESSFLTKDYVQRTSMRIGEDVFLVGLFSKHYTERNSGYDRNIASGRFGCISKMASDGAKIAHWAGSTKYEERPRFVADIRSRAGYSGSPVFVYRSLDLTGFDKTGEGYVIGGGGAGGDEGGTFIKLLGVYCSQYDEDVVVSRESEHLAEKTLRLPGAMTTIVPAWNITRLLDNEKFKQVREIREHKIPIDFPRAES